MKKISEKNTKNIVGGGYHWICEKTRYLGYNYGNNYNSCLRAAGRHTGRYGGSHRTRVIWCEKY